MLSWPLDFMVHRDDPRVRYVPIFTSSINRGKLLNGAGLVRNEIIQKHAVSEWVAFVDDDDTLSPYYVEYLNQGIAASTKRDLPSSDIIIFRMQDPQERLFPPLRHGVVAKMYSVGISFAVQRNLFVYDSAYVFVPSFVEDFLFLERAQYEGLQIEISSCVAYFVKQNPPTESLLSAGPDSCQFDKAIISRGFFSFW